MKTTRLNFTTDWRGLTDYAAALELQRAAWEKRRSGALPETATSSWRMNLPSEDQLFGFEHPAVITLGSRGSATVDVVGHEIPHEIPVVPTDRGGQATLHSPGQLVIYPIFDLRARGLGVREFVEALQEATRRLLLEFGVASTPADGAGLVTERGKIAFIGLRIERGITRHGVSLNVANDLSLFGSIRSCGVRGAALDRLADHVAEPPSLQLLFEAWSGHFACILASLKSPEKPHKPLEVPETSC